MHKIVAAVSNTFFVFSFRVYLRVFLKASAMTLPCHTNTD